jgi:heme/copper-type cytochrome/quinol oxidase subunit 2
MTIRLLGRIFFPNQQEWQRHQKAKHLIVAFVVGILFAAVMVSVMYCAAVRNSKTTGSKSPPFPRAASAFRA